MGKEYLFTFKSLNAIEKERLLSNESLKNEYQFIVRPLSMESALKEFVSSIKDPCCSTHLWGFKNYKTSWHKND